jgi:hypothetical protein
MPADEIIILNPPKKPPARKAPVQRPKPPVKPKK